MKNKHILDKLIYMIIGKTNAIYLLIYDNVIRYYQLRKRRNVFDLTSNQTWKRPT